jgi:hypothetical protein
MDYRHLCDMTGSVPVITGGARSIGFESAVALGSCGARGFDNHPPAGLPSAAPLAAAA